MLALFDSLPSLATACHRICRSIALCLIFGTHAGKPEDIPSPTTKIFWPRIAVGGKGLCRLTQPSMSFGFSSFLLSLRDNEASITRKNMGGSQRMPGCLLSPTKSPYCLLLPGSQVIATTKNNGRNFRSFAHDTMVPMLSPLRSMIFAL